jgi:signal transduction histidine kinase
MAEVATGVLHNVGNVLNSVNVSASLLASGLRHAKVDSLARLSALLRAHAGDLGAFLTTDPRGRRVPEFVESLAQDWAGEQARLLKEIESLQQNIDHIKDIVSMQQSYATMVSLVEPLPPAALMEDAVRMNSAALSRHEVRVLRDFQPVPLVSAEKAKVLQILVNLVRNAKYACDDGPNSADKAITLRLALAPGGRAVRLVVADNGVGIPAANLTRIFNHGFTTRATGHGFGLHSSANAAKEMKGTLSVHSDGPGTGATFTLELPVATPNPGPDSDQGLDEAGPV